MLPEPQAGSSADLDFQVCGSFPIGRTADPKKGSALHATRLLVYLRNDSRQTIDGSADEFFTSAALTKRQGSELDLYDVLSTWNPYVVVLMKSRLRVE